MFLGDFLYMHLHIIGSSVRSVRGSMHLLVLLARATIECRMGWNYTADVAFDVYAMILGTHRDVFDARAFLRQYPRSWKIYLKIF